ncbi:EAL domain-containing protein [Oxalobacteraceae bacterium A2-2]
MDDGLRSGVTEQARIQALYSLGVLDTAGGEYFDAVTRLALDLFGASGSYISLIDKDRQWLKANIGVCPITSSRDESFCNHTIEHSEVLVVPDTRLDPRFAHQPAVTMDGVLFYAGAPLITSEGYAIGALCIIDQQPRQLAPDQAAKLASLAALVVAHMELGRAVGHVDAVSGMPNKYRLHEELDALAAQSPQDSRALLSIDMPDAATAFQIASVLGVAVYDQMVRAAGQRLREVFQGRAQVYHLTDARFAVLSTDADTEEFTRFVRAAEVRLQAPLADVAIPLNLPSYGGIVAFRLADAADAPRKAASALTQAQLGQQRWAIYNAGYDTCHQRAFRLLNDVLSSIRDNHFHLLYQPKHDIASGACGAAEALLRWQHPELGYISPAEFIPLVEKTALIGPLTDWVMRSAIGQAARWYADGRPIKVAINLSAYNFEEHDIAARLGGICAAHGLPPAYVEVECTEGVWMQSPAVLQALHDIRALGMSIALDDFGTGYSNFAYLQKVPASVIKVDQSLVRDLHANARDQRIVRALIALARELDYEVVAEGVETPQSLELIREWGGHVAQGYHFARPLAPDAFMAHVAQSCSLA